MAWEDHEELKSLEHRSMRYKITYPGKYGMDLTDMIYNLIVNDNVHAKELSYYLKKDEHIQYAWEVQQELEFKKIAGSIQTMADNSTQKKVTQSGKEQKSLNKKDNNKNLNILKFNEDKYLKEAEQYINNTYNQHYAADQDVQSIEMIISSGHGEGFAMGNIQKLSARYGKKNGYDRLDLLKILHYGVLALYIHDKFQKGK